MYLLSFIQENMETKIGLFESIEQGRKVIRTIPGYEALNYGEYIEESFDPQELPKYMELDFQGTIVPLSRFMFVEPGKVLINWESLPELSAPGKGMLDSATRVDAYMVENEDVEEYIEQRENNYQWVKKNLELRGYEVERAYFGSEDGEAIIYRKRIAPEKDVQKENNESKTKENPWHFLIHMDPLFVEEENLPELLNELVGDNLF